MEWLVVHLWPVSFLTIAVVDDLLYKKFHNLLFIALATAGLVYAFGDSSLSWQQSLLGFFVGGLVLLPLVLANAIGAGDMKFMMCLGLLLGAIAIFWVFVYALFWGALIGVLKALLSGQGIAVFWRTLGIFQRIRPNQTSNVEAFLCLPGVRQNVGD